MATVHKGELADETEVFSETIDSSATLMALNSSEIDTQIATAKRYPRSLKRFLNEALEMVTLSEDIAGECIYALPRGGKSIEGPSARFAEIVVSAWGNCRAGTRVVAEDDRFVTSQGVFIDLQRNTAITCEVKRRITDKHGNRFKDDMIGVTSNAACSIALRNAVLKGVPKAFWRKLYDEARRVAIGDVKTLATRRGAMIAAFGKMGVTPEVIFEKLEIAGEPDITLDHLGVLRGMYTAIKEGDSTIEQLFSRDTEQTRAKVKPSKLNDTPKRDTDEIKRQDEMDVDQRGSDDGTDNPANETPEERADREREELERTASGKKGRQKTAFDTAPNLGQ